jgi:hypothetical protein
MMWNKWMYGFGIDYYKDHILMLSFVIYIYIYIYIYNAYVYVFGSPKACAINLKKIWIKICIISLK